MKRIVLVIFILFPVLGFSQNVQDLINNLKKELNNNPDQKQKATIYSDLTWYYANVSLDSALVYGNKAITASEKLNDSTLLAQVYSDIGAVYFRKPDFQNSKKYYLKAYKIRKIRKDYIGLAKINNNLASIYMNTQQYQLAMKTYLESLRYFENNNDKKNAAVTKANIGQLYIDLREYKKAIKYIKEAVLFAENEKLIDRLCENYLNLAKAYESRGDYKNALFYNDKSLKNCIEVGNKKATAIVYQRNAIVNSRINNDSIAKVNLEKSQKIFNKYNSSLDNANVKLSLVRNLIKEKKYNESLKILIEIKKVFEKGNSKMDLLYTYKNLIPVYANLDKPDSVTYYVNKYSTLYERILQDKAVKQSAELETKYQTAKKEKLLLQKEIEVKNTRNKLIAVSSLALFTGLLGFLIYRQQKLKNKQQEQEFQLKSAIAQIETQNQLQEQRLSISRDLHDNIGAQLTFVISSVDNLKHGNQITDNKIVNQLTKISDFTKSTIIDLRDTIWAMNSNEFSFEDLRSRIFNFIEKAKSAKENIDFKFNVDDSLQDLKFSSLIGINLYRTIQEAINNAVKYSDANEIIVEVKNVFNKIQIEIQDNGKGFDIENTEFGNGLYNMKKRIEEIDGTFEINSMINKGTKIRFEIQKKI